MNLIQERRRLSARERVLAGGLDVLERDGLEAVTVRRIASELDCTPPVIYQHFTNKDALLGEIISLGFDRLAARIRATAVGSPVEQICAAGQEYVDAALSSPHLYRLMTSTSVLDSAQRQHSATAITQDTEALLTTWAAESCISLQIPRAGELLWAVLHGVAHIALLTGADRLESKHLAEASVASLLAGWSANLPIYLLGEES